MPIIHELTDDIVSQIAAGEIIERPAYALKELIDNAIDAKASQIQISLTEAGLTKIIIDDDGIGMDQEDVQTCWKLHTTSKLHSSEELHAIHTQGFRGEALSSIAATSDLTIQSKQSADTLGYEVQIKDQRIFHQGQIGMPAGTRIIVENLFETLPARKKFLQSKQTELRHCLEVVTTYAIAYPQIRFVLKHDGKTLLSLSTTSQRIERLGALFDEDLVQTLLPIRFQESYITIEGYVSHPSKATASVSKQFIFLNARPIKDKVISQAVREALSETLPRNKHPIFFLYLQIPVELIDINVHPRKEIVRFSSPDTVYSAVQQAVQEMMISQALTFQSSLQKEETSGKITHSFAGKLLKEQALPPPMRIPKTITCSQLHETYIVFQTDNGIVFIDQHAAQERTFYEKLKSEFVTQQQKRKTVSIRIAFPLSQADELLLKEHSEKLEELGFTFEQSTIKNRSKTYITSVPELFADRDPIPILEEFFSDVEKGLPIRTTDSLTHSMLTYIACRSSVKAGDVLSQKQMRDIVHELQKVPNRYTCPHGRPTMIEVPLKKLHTLFKRL